MTAIVLTPHQTEAVQFVTDHLHDGDPIVALRGLAGTGKTSLIPALIDVLEQTGIPVTLGAPTHRAAMILKQKGLTQADTVHAHALTPYFTGDYTKALRWLGGSCQCRIEDLANAQPAVDGVPWLVAERLKITGHTPEVVKSRARHHDPKKALESIGITGRKHFAGFGPKEGTGVLIIDEASMVGADMLKLCQEAFPQICLVGDPGQLPPVKDAGILAGVPGFELTEVHRQAKDSRIVQLAYAARAGEKFWESIPSVAGEVEEYTAVEAARFLEAPLVVWRNKTRVECTAAIRAALGFPHDVPQVGEPLVCRSSDPRARADGLYNNALFRVVAPSVVVAQQDNPRMVTIQPDGNPDAETLDVLVHMDETDGDNIDPDAILFRWAYTLTAHTAQGGEWPTVYISKPDLFAHSKRSPQEGEDDDFARWAYTAITRAKQTLGFVRKHDFTGTVSVAPTPWLLPPIGDEAPPGVEHQQQPNVAPPSVPTTIPLMPQGASSLSTLQGDVMPKMQQEPKQPRVTPPSAPMMQMDAPDDIQDPVVPATLAAETMGSPGMGLPTAAPTTAMVPTHGTAAPGTHPQTIEPSWSQHEALLHGFCQALQGQMSRIMGDEAGRLSAEIDRTVNRMYDYAKGRLEGNEHAAYQLANALAQVQEKGLTIHGSPYEITLQVYTPAGVPLTLTVRKTTPAELLDELTRLETWLALQGYRGTREEAVASA